MSGKGVKEEGNTAAEMPEAPGICCSLLSSCKPVNPLLPPAALSTSPVKVVWKCIANSTNTHFEARTPYLQ